MAGLLAILLGLFSITFGMFVKGWRDHGPYEAAAGAWSTPTGRVIKGWANILGGSVLVIVGVWLVLNHR